MIVVDEFYSLVMDASYQTAPFYVNSLIWEIAYRHHRADEKETGNDDDPENCIFRPLCKHLVLMTGTPDTVRKYPDPYIKLHILDMMDICVNVVPKNVWFLDMKQAREQLALLHAENRRCIYFTNHILYPEAFCKGTTMEPNTVAVSFSSKERRDALATAARIPADQRDDEQQKLPQIYNVPYRKDGHVIRRYIEQIHGAEQYVRYDYFRNYFCYYYLKAFAQHYR
jgi:hypothetical protein